MSEGRESLKEACAVVVEDAINAVLLGLRERVSLRFRLLPREYFPPLFCFLSHLFSGARSVN